MADFSSLGLSDWLVKQCKQLGINKPTPVQENCVPAILQGETASVKSSGDEQTTRISTCNVNNFLTTFERLDQQSRQVMQNSIEKSINYKKINTLN